MRKIVSLLIILTVFSFSIVYAQEIYSLDINKNDQVKEVVVQNQQGQKEPVVDKRESKNEVKEKEDIEEKENHKLPSQSNKEEGKKNDSISSSTKEVQASTSKPPVKKESSTENPSTISKSTTSTPVQTTTKQESKPEVKPEVAPKVDATPIIDAGNANNGSFKAKYYSDKKLKVMVVKGGEKYTYDLKGDNKFQSYPLQLGDGVYKVSILENKDGKEYRYVLTKEVTVKTSNPNAKYLTSVQMMNWNDSMAAIKKAKSLTSGLSDEQKINKIYSYVSNNIKYDSSITKLPNGYIPSINATYSSKSGICYDFASVFGGMLRSVGVPTKLIKGTATNVTGYHAWNEVYVNGGWKIIDTSYDSQLKEAGHKVNMYKSSSQYSKSKEY